MKKLLVAVMTVVAIITTASLSAQTSAEQIASIQKLSADDALKQLTSIYKQAVKSPETVIKEDLKKRVITITTTTKDRALNDTLNDVTLKKMYLSQITKDKEQNKVFKALFTQSKATLILTFTGSNKSVSCSISAADF